MGFQKVDERKEVNYLKTEDLANQVPCRVICYVTKTMSKISRMDKGFHTLLVRTCDGVTVPARIFYSDMDGFIESGVDVNALRGKFIGMDCVPNVWESQYTIKVKKIYIIDQNLVTDKSLFLGKVDNTDLLFSQCEKAFSSLEHGILPTSYKFNGYPSVYNGIMGGYLQFVWTWTYQCMVYNAEFGQDFINTLYNCVVHYGNYLDRIATEEYESYLGKVETLKTIPVVDKQSGQIILDCMQSILGLGKPEHLYANIIYDAFMSTLKTSNMLNDWKLLTRGGVSSSRDYTLRKY